MAGLRMICKIYGGLTVTDGKKTTKWLWDYDKDCPVTEEEMKNREKLAKSERKKWKEIEKKMKEEAKKAQGELF